MKFQALDNWAYTENLEGLLLFVQRLHEQTFDQTSYVAKENRIPAWEIIDEILSLFDLSESTKLDERSITEFEVLMEELSYRVQEDEVSKCLIGGKYNLYMSDSRNHSHINSARQSLEIMKNSISPSKYLEEIVTRIKESILNYKKKDRIITLTDRFFEFLLSRGYQKGTIQHLVNTYFFDKKTNKRILFPNVEYNLR